MITDPQRLLALLNDGHDPRREVYVSADGDWFVTYGGGEVDRHAVTDLVRSGKIVPKYSDIPNGCFYTGKTIDTERTKVMRKLRGKKHPLCYVGEP
jgi:hypothetical protein